MERYSDIAFGPGSRAHQEERGSLRAYTDLASIPPPDALGPDEVEFLEQRDSFYLASTTEDGWPYVQHRGGPRGFVRVIGPHRIAWADRSGNRQFVSAGNIDHDDRVAMIAVDYPARQRLKLFGHATFDAHPDLSRLEGLGIEGRLEGLVTIDVVAFDWNCSKYITPRFTEQEVVAATESLHRRIAELEAR